jgi:copper chaperone CopZ
MSTSDSGAAVTLPIDGMSCQHCVRAVTLALQSVPGVQVQHVSVGTATFTAPDATAQARAVEAITDAGFEPRAPRQPGVPGSR